MPGPIVTRRIERYEKEPLSVRNAMAVIIVATAGTVLAGGFLVWLFDRSDFPDLGLAFWWTLQTVTTVGYGDVTPTNGFGRAVGSFVMLESIAFLSVITATITSSFVQRARADRLIEEHRRNSEAMQEALQALTHQVESLEASIRDLRRST